MAAKKGSKKKMAKHAGESPQNDSKSNRMEDNGEADERGAKKKRNTASGDGEETETTLLALAGETPIIPPG
jgi:hypothetical protein